ncbi:Protein C15C7.5, partial [Aphelenchoides avenae]
IRKLDSQLDHLNEYVGKVEERIKLHNAKMLETLRHQREEREKRRRSFHERLEADRQEDVEFQNQLASILHRLDISRKRQSAYDLSNVEIPAVGNGVHADHKPSVL